MIFLHSGTFQSWMMFLHSGTFQSWMMFLHSGTFQSCNIYIYIFFFFFAWTFNQTVNNSSHPSRNLPFFTGLDLQYFSVEVMEPAWWGTSRASQVSTGEHVSLGCDRRTSCMGWIHPQKFNGWNPKITKIWRGNIIWTNLHDFWLVPAGFFQGVAAGSCVKKRCSRESCRYWRFAHSLHLVMVWRRF